jgi:hypothetical protein
MDVPRPAGGGAVPSPSVAEIDNADTMFHPGPHHDGLLLDSGKGYALANKLRIQ